MLGVVASAIGAPETRPLVKCEAVPLKQVQIRDAFWAPRREMNRKVSLVHNLDMLERSGNVRNFELAAAGKHEGYSGPVYMDSDIYKAIEAVSYSLATDPDPELDKRVDAMIAKIAAAQMPDGYLDTHYQVNAPTKRFTNLRDHHELYCAGHLFEAAVAHFQATGKRTLLDVATRYADHIASIFGDVPGKRMGYPGHPECELALVKLSRATGQRRYFDLSRFFVENRGTHFFATEHATPLDHYDGTYWLDEVPIRERRTIAGHAVRAGYLFSGVVDVARETGDAALLAMIDRVWKDATLKKTYVTGGIGPSGSNEGFTTEYDLPNLTAYQETCASVAMAMWNHRLNLLYGDARYADCVEQALYNGVLAGVSLDGKKFFYDNPLESRGDHHRSDWFGCACCPPNEARTLSGLGEYVYATSERALWVNLYVKGAVEATVAVARIAMDVATDYPWDGAVKFTLRPERETTFGLRLRVPGWCRGASAKVNGAAESAPVERGYLVLDRAWKAGDVVDLDLPMPVRRVEASPLVADDRGTLAIARGPIVYCLEGCDHDVPVTSIAIPAGATLTPKREPDLLGGIVVLHGDGEVAGESEWPGGLYRTAAPPKRVAVTAVPYCVWDNRAAGEMRVWIPTSPPAPIAGGPERRAKIALSFTSGNSQPWGINDGVEPKSSSEQPAALCHWWPHKGGDEWVEYTWPKPITTNGVRVYFFDDTGRGECRLPTAWKLEAKDGDTWKPVDVPSGFAVKKDTWCEARFAPLTTTALRIAVTMQPGFAAGIHEWKILATDEE
ncbi:MAG: glycoside hydrolase family 127 protein [Planctomycetes bacterium]|nr:glycoside hydrolase family 127 protein [Planctomycetota bacterium]